MKNADQYRFDEAEAVVSGLWSGLSQHTEQNHKNKKFTHFLIPPNASGPIHIGNALMVALQDILTRYYHAQGFATIWVPGLDHGGYETQVTYEREQEQKGETRLRHEYPSDELYTNIESFVEKHKETITRQIERLGARIDWQHLRHTLDDVALVSAQKMFEKMVEDGLIYREPYMVHYCPHCETMLADIELKQVEFETPLYEIVCQIQNSPETVSLYTTEPEFMFSVTHVLVHPEDTRFAQLIGTVLVNPVTQKPIEIVPSARKLSWHQEQEHLVPLFQSHVRYDYEYAIRHDILARDIFAWDGTFSVQYPGQEPTVVRQEVIHTLQQSGVVVQQVGSVTDTHLYCKKGHKTNTLIRLSWFLNVDDERMSLRQRALEALQKDSLTITPSWRKKGLVQWIEKMHDWPIARQNVWGVRIPVWYKIDDPQKFVVWFFNANKERISGRLDELLEQGYNIDNIIAGLQRVYAESDCTWVLSPETGGQYLPETDTFDTWFSSGAWSVFVYDHLAKDDQKPSDTVVIGHDLLRLCIAREIMLGVYLTGRLPFKKVYFHPLLQAADGQKMSKSAGNAIDLNAYIEKYGADVTRAAIVAHLTTMDDFVFSDEHVYQTQKFIEALWDLCGVYQLLFEYNVPPANQKCDVDNTKVAAMAWDVGGSIRKHYFAQAQATTQKFLTQLQTQAQAIINGDFEHAPSAFIDNFKKYLTVLHPFMPIVTEYIYQELPDTTGLLAQATWPKRTHASKKRAARKDDKSALRDILKQL